MNSSTSTKLLLAAMVAVLCSAVGCTHGSSADAAAEAVASVTVTQVTRSNISRTLSVTGTIAAPPNEDVKVSSLVPGRIARILVAEGEHVAAHQVLAQIDSSTLRDQVQQAEGALQQAKASLQNATANRQRQESLLQRGIAAGKEVEDARTQETVAQGALNQAEAALSIAHQQLARAEIRSPIDAVVVKRFVNGGEQVDGTAAQPVVEVANVQMVELLGNVPADYLSKIHVGQKLTLTSEGVPGITFNASVFAVSPAVDPASNVGLVRIRIANPKGLLRLGMFLSAPVAVDSHSNALVVPPQAIYRGEDAQPHVYRIKEDKDGAKAELVAVKVGLETPDKTELVDGVNEGDTVILNGGYGLDDGAKVKVQK